MEADDFVNINDMTAVRGYFIDNRLGHLDEALAVANDPAGGTYPVGTIIQLVPQEAMVKRARLSPPPTTGSSSASPSRPRAPRSSPGAAPR